MLIRYVQHKLKINEGDFQLEMKRKNTQPINVSTSSNSVTWNSLYSVKISRYGAYSKCNVIMTVFTFLGPSWMMRSYSIPSSAMSQPHWYNWYCCSTRTDRQTWGWGTARGRRDWLYRLRQKFPDKPRPVTRKDHFGTLQHIIQTGRM